MKRPAATALFVCATLAGCDNGNDEMADDGARTTPPQEFGKRDWNKHPPATEFEKLAFFHETFQESRYRAVLKTGLTLRDEGGNVVAHLKPGLIVHSPSMTDVDDTDLSDNRREKILFDLPAGTELEYLQQADRATLGETWYRNAASIPGGNTDGGQDADAQPPACAESEAR